MSQQTLDTFQSAPEPTYADVPDGSVDAVHWDPFAQAGIEISDEEDDGAEPDFTRCLNCGAHLSEGLRRVYGVGDEHVVDGCPDCRSGRELMQGETVPGRDPRPSPDWRRDE